MYVCTCKPKTTVMCSMNMMIMSCQSVNLVLVYGLLYIAG